MIEEGFIGSLDDIWFENGEKGYFFARQVGTYKGWVQVLYVKRRVEIIDSMSKASIGGSHYYVVDVMGYRGPLEKNLTYLWKDKKHIFLGPKNNA